MTIEIKHEAFLNILMKSREILNDLFYDVKTIKHLVKNIKSYSEYYENFGYPDKYKMQGDVFEIFAEIFFKLMSADGRVGIFEYTPVHAVDDYGVDATGIGLDNKPAAIQIKFRGNTSKELLPKELKQFVANALRMHSVLPDTQNNLVVFTTGKGMHWSAEKSIGTVRTIGYPELSKWLDNNTGFWVNLNKMLNENIQNV
jgi:hypothetical protein